MRLKPNNFVAPLTNIEKPSESLPIAPPLGRRITVDPGAIFAEPVVKQPTPIDYVSQGNSNTYNLLNMSDNLDKLLRGRNGIISELRNKESQFFLKFLEDSMG